MNIKHVLVLCVAVLTWPLAAAADEGEAPEALVITLNSGQGQVQGAALELAGYLAREDGKDVHVVLCGEAGELALEQNIPPALEPRSVSPKEMLMEAMTAGAEVYLCHLFLPNARIRQYDEDDLVDGITQIGPAAMAELVQQPLTRILGY
jgi:predicted peroxiredoxin